MKQNRVLMILLVGLAAIITIGVGMQRPLDPALILGASGFLLLTLAWVGMYFRLAREAPDHRLVNATYLNFPAGLGRRAGAKNLFALVRLHFERHRVDLWTILLIAGVAMLAAGLIESAV